MLGPADYEACPSTPWSSKRPREPARPAKPAFQTPAEQRPALEGEVLGQPDDPSRCGPSSTTYPGG